MSRILRWGLGIGLAIALVDVLAGELGRGVTNVDLTAAIELVDLLVNLGLFGLVGFRVARALGDLRSGLESAVLASLVVGVVQIVYQLVRAPVALTAVAAVSILAYNIVLAAAAGAMGAWAGSRTRGEIPPSQGGGHRR